MMLSPVLDRENGDWVFLSWQLSLSCVMGVLAYMAFVWQGSARWGITAALSVVLLVWLIGEALMIKYISSLPSDEDHGEVQGEEADKVSKSWVSLRKKYHTLDEDSYGSRRSRRIARSTKRDKSAQPGNPEDSLRKIVKTTSETMADSTEESDATVYDSVASPEVSDDSVDDSVETTVIPMSEMQAYLRRLQDENSSGS